MIFSSVQMETSPLKIRTMSTSPGGSIQRQQHKRSYRDDNQSSDVIFYHSTNTPSTSKDYLNTTTHKDRSQHATVVTLERVLKEQSVLRAEARTEHSTDKTNRTVRDLQNLFEKRLTSATDSYIDDTDEEAS